LIRGAGARGAGGWAGAEGVADPRAAAGEGVDLAGAAAPRAGFRLLLVGALRPRPRWGSDWLLCAGGVGKGNDARTDATIKLPGWTDAIASSHYGQRTICSSSISTSRTSS